MNYDLHSGKLKRWNDDKGFGFVASEDGVKDIFLHISALKRMNRRPIEGDVIIYQVHTDNDGKMKAINARIEGVSEIKSRPIRRINRRHATNKKFSKITSIAFLIFLGVVAYSKFINHNKHRENSVVPMFSLGAEEINKKKYSCEGKVYCSEMTSCDEARFYLKNCPRTKMDGDGDGIPCESQWCN